MGVGGHAAMRKRADRREKRQHGEVVMQTPMWGFRAPGFGFRIQGCSRRHAWGVTRWWRNSGARIALTNHAHTARLDSGGDLFMSRARSGE